MTRLLTAEKRILDKLSPPLRGFHLMFMGHHRTPEWLPKNNLHCFTVSPTKGNVLSRYETLPIRTQSIDSIILPYELEHARYPLPLLMELHRCLVNHGRLFIFVRQSWHPLNIFHKSLSLIKIQHLLQQASFTYKNIQWLHFGSVIFIEAHKNNPAVTPLKAEWEKKLMLGKQWQPTTRGMSRESSHD
jgi:SAM-dependent methyltransferase